MSSILVIIIEYRSNEYEDCKQLYSSMEAPIPFSDVTEEMLQGFDAVYIPGGHGPMTDLGNNEELGRILNHFHDNNKLTASICHGPVALLSAKKDSKKYYLKCSNRKKTFGHIPDTR